MQKNNNKHRNPAKVRELKELINLKENELIELKHQLKSELELVPVGYELIGSGSIVTEGALGYEPYHGVWINVGNSIGKTLNEQGYVTGITHKGWKYANPIQTTVINENKCCGRCIDGLDTCIFNTEDE